VFTRGDACAVDDNACAWQSWEHRCRKNSQLPSRQVAAQPRILHIAPLAVMPKKRANRVLGLRCAAELVKAHQRRRKLRVVNQGKVLVEVRKEQNGQLQARLVHGKLGFTQITLAVLRLDFSL